MVKQIPMSDQPIVGISHIGSTAIQGIWAKNIKGGLML